LVVDLGAVLRGAGSGGAMTERKHAPVAVPIELVALPASVGGLARRHPVTIADV
jgi:hypothetical protein